MELMIKEKDLDKLYATQRKTVLELERIMGELTYLCESLPKHVNSDEIYSLCYYKEAMKNLKIGFQGLGFVVTKPIIPERNNRKQ